MLAPPAQKTLRVALLGNPNTGKSTLFNALAGVRQRVGNYPGVTVEKKTGLMDYQGRRYELVDLPGLVSLAPRSRDEMVSVDVLLGRGPQSEPVDAVVCLVDAGNLDRHLYLVSQVLELGLPTVVAVNMIDIAERRGVKPDLPLLEERLGTPVVALQANRGIGVPELRDALAGVVDRPPAAVASPLPEAFEDEVTRLEQLLGQESHEGNGKAPARYLVQRLLLDTSGYLQGVLLSSSNGQVAEEMEAARSRLAEAGCPVPGVETSARYAWVRRMLDGVVTHPDHYGHTVTDRIDHVLTHRIWGTLIFAAVMVVVFQAVFRWAEPLMDWIESGVSWVGDLVAARMAEGALQSLLVDGVIGGVGGVLVFLPQILILFAFIAVLEDCGYMARAAYLMDKFMVRIGLSGKSFIPMLSSFACAIPGIMAARVIENERDRLTTILVAPLMTCSARLPVYALLIAAFIPKRIYWGILGLQGLTLAALYVVGIVTAVTVALVLKRTLLRGEAPPFLMELPSYKRPSLRNVVFRVTERGWLFVRCAGTLILAVSIIVWAAAYYPHNAAQVEAPYRARRSTLEAQLAQLPPAAQGRRAAADELAEIEREVQGAYLRQSVLGRAGHVIEPVFRPLGWDWRISSAVLASFPAREIVVATLGVIFNLGEDVDSGDEGITKLGSRMHAATRDDGRPLFNVPVALSIMVFFALCAQCAATLAVIRRETNSWRWPAFTFTYMTVLAYVAALVTYHVGTWVAG